MHRGEAVRTRILAAILCPSAAAQGLLAQQIARRSVRAIGEASVSVRPDAARVTVSVMKRADTVTAAVIAALRQLLGSNAELRTTAYSLAPVYVEKPLL